MMKITKTMLVGMLSLGLVASGVSAASAASAPASTERGTASARATSDRFDGEELFRGVVFGQGKAGRVLGDLTAPVQITREVESEIDRIVADIRTEDPGFFAQFATRAQSGDVIQVRDAFADLGRALDRTLNNLGYEDGSNAATVTPRCIQVVLFAVGALVYAGAAILQVAAVAVSIWWAGPRTSEGQPQLSYEKWIAEATVRLAR
jgi:SdpC family antimicrobial peptide